MTHGFNSKMTKEQISKLLKTNLDEPQAIDASNEHSVLLGDISLLIEQSKQELVARVNSSISILFWMVGKRISDEILQHNRADYGKQIVVTLSRELVKKYGRNFEEKNLRRMLQFADQFKDKEIVVTLSRQLVERHGKNLRQIKRKCHE